MIDIISGELLRNSVIKKDELHNKAASDVSDLLKIYKFFLKKIINKSYDSDYIDC